MPKRAVIYARFSCNRQREASIEDQLRVCREWCAREGYEVAAEYCDRAVSGRTDDRPVCLDSRTEICAVGTVVLLRIPRAA